MSVSPLLEKALGRGHGAGVLGGAHESAVLLAVATVRAGQLGLVRQRLVLVAAHLERCLAGGAFAPKVAVVVAGDGDRYLEAVVGLRDLSNPVGPG